MTWRNTISVDTNQKAVALNRIALVEVHGYDPNKTIGLVLLSTVGGIAKGVILGNAVGQAIAGSSK